MELIYNLMDLIDFTVKGFGAIPAFGIPILASIVIPLIIRAMKRW